MLMKDCVCTNSQVFSWGIGEEVPSLAWMEVAAVVAKFQCKLLAGAVPSRTRVVLLGSMWLVLARGKSRCLAGSPSIAPRAQGRGL
jgi:hypothetical protein